MARAFLIIHDRGLLVLDRVIAPGGGGQPAEVRTFTPRQATFGENDVLLEGESQTARMTFASNVPSTLSRHAALLTLRSANPPTMMRWQTNKQETSILMASLLTCGSAPVALSVVLEQTQDPDSDEMHDGPIIITMKGRNWSESIRLTDRLEPVTADTTSGTGPYKTDITEWNELRKVPAMKTYFNNMNLYHISYAAFGDDGKATQSYIRGRRYMPNRTGLKGTDLEPDYYFDDLFETGVSGLQGNRLTIKNAKNDARIWWAGLLGRMIIVEIHFNYGTRGIHGKRCFTDGLTEIGFAVFPYDDSFRAFRVFRS